jgi:hypothetical protein
MKFFSSAIKSYFILVGLYLLLIIFLPANKIARAEYHLSILQYHILLVIVVLPLIAIWFTAFYGYAQLLRYAQSITISRESKGFAELARGCRWLAWGFPIPSIISIVLNAILNNHPGFKGADVIIDNYIALLIPLVAFSILSSGSRLLSHRALLQISARALKLIVIIFVVIGVLFCYLTFRQVNLRDTTSTDNPFYLPIWLMVITLTIPYLYAWFTGLLAAYEISAYARHSAGILYRRPLALLTIGIILVIAGSITLQYFTSVEHRSLHLSLDGQLVATDGIRFIAGIGYILIAFGASRLRKIEEV